MRTRTKGILLAPGGERVVNKQFRGQRIFQRLGAVSQEEAESWLREQQARIEVEQQQSGGAGHRPVWADGAGKYLIECEARKVRTIELIAYHVELLLPYIGKLPMEEMCNESFEPFVADRQEDGVKNATINRSLEVGRTVTNRAARVWRTNGKPWISVNPLIEMLDEKAQRRPPRPISWAEQAMLMPALASHLQDAALFMVNTGARDENVCGLRWAWEVPVPELKRSVFVIPPEAYKANRAHVLILNDVAWNIVQSRRGQHAEYVFTYTPPAPKKGEPKRPQEPHRIDTLNNTGYQRARREVGLQGVRIHDLRHTFGQRLRDAGVTGEDRALLLGHAVEGMTEHYATATVARLVEMANKVQNTVDRTTLLRVVNG